MTVRRVLHVLKFYRPDFTGEGVFLERSSAIMQELAPDVEHDLLVTRTPGGDLSTPVFSTLRKVIHLSRRRTGTLLHHASMLAWFVRHAHHYDTVHFRTHADWYFLTYGLIRLLGRRLVISATLDDSVPTLVSHYRPSLRWLAARGFRLFHAYVSISPKLHAQTLSAVAEPGRCHLVPCGVTVPAQGPGQRAAMRARLGLDPSAIVILFVGGLCARKDPRALVEALPAIRATSPDVRLLLVGPELEPDYVAALRARITALGLDRAVIFAGEQFDPHPWFAASDILAFASHLEGFGTVVPEAMTHGLAVLVRRLPAVNDDFVLPDETGILFEDQPGLVAGAIRLVGDAPLRARLGAAARRLAQARFGMRGVAARYLGIYGFPPADLPPPDAPPSALGTSASVLDRRFHLPTVATASDVPLLITTVDAEEAFDWFRPFDRRNTDVTSMAAQHHAHRVFDRHGVRPVYLVDYPVAECDAGRAPLRELVTGGHAEIGSQLHPWVTPPFAEVVNTHNSFAGNLPLLLELEKARRLTGAIEDAFGIRPRIWRTGRFGVGARTADILKLLEYEVDSSVVPLWPPENCPRLDEFWTISAKPYWLDQQRTLMEIPVSAALSGRLAGVAGSRVASGLFHPLAARLGLTGLAAQLGLIERIRLSPEGMTVDEAKRLTRAMYAAGHRVFVVTYHSPSLEPGNTPYVRTERDREIFLAWLDEFYTFFREELGGRPASWREVRWGAGMPAA